jgi:hypothetical protein
METRSEGLMPIYLDMIHLEPGQTIEILGRRRTDIHGSLDLVNMRGGEGSRVIQHLKDQERK